jgi:hypothetical protein
LLNKEPLGLEKPKGFFNFFWTNQAIPNRLTLPLGEKFSSTKRDQTIWSTIEFSDWRAADNANLGWKFTT